MTSSENRQRQPWPDSRAVWLDARGLQRGFKEHVGRGIGTYVSALAAALDAASAEGRVRMFVERGADLVASIPRSRLIDVPVPLRGGGRIGAQLRQHVVLAAWLAARGPAAVHFAAQTDATVAAGVRSIVTVHDVFPHREPTTRRGVAGARSRIARAVERLAIRRAARLIVPSRVTADELIETLAVPRSRIAVIPNAVAPWFGASASDTDATTRARLKLPTRYLLHAGGADARKRLPELIAVFDRLAAEHRDLGLVLVGPVTGGDGGPAVLRAVRDAVARDRIALTGVLDDRDMPAVYRGAAAVVLATRHEGFGLPVVEAFASGAPVVATAAPAVAEVAGDAALLVPVERVDALVDALRQLLRDPDLAATLRAKGLQRAQQFRWSVNAAETLVLYGQVSGLSGLARTPF